jgi:hypothetical protein
MGCINNNKQIELKANSSELEFKNKLLKHVLDSIIAIENNVNNVNNDMAISLIINGNDSYLKLLYIYKIKRKSFLKEEEDNPQIISSYKGIPVYVFINSYDKLFYSFEKEKVRNELIHIIYDKPIRLLLKGDSMEYHNRW